LHSGYKSERLVKDPEDSGTLNELEETPKKISNKNKSKDTRLVRTNDKKREKKKK